MTETNEKLNHNIKKTMAIPRSPVLSGMFQKAEKKKLTEEEQKLAQRDGAVHPDRLKLGFKEGDDTRKMVGSLRDEVGACRRDRPRSSQSVKTRSLHSGVLVSPTKGNAPFDLNQRAAVGNCAASGFETAQSAMLKQPRVRKIKSMKHQARDIFCRP